MELIVSYRPVSGVLKLWNSIDDELTDVERDLLERVYDSNADSWNVSASFHKGNFHSFTALDVRGHALIWGAWLSLYLSDEVVKSIHELVNEWDNEVDAIDDFHTRVLAVRRTVITV